MPHRNRPPNRRRESNKAEVPSYGMLKGKRPKAHGGEAFREALGWRRCDSIRRVSSWQGQGHSGMMRTFENKDETAQPQYPAFVVFA